MFDEAFCEFIARARRQGGSFALLLVDLDNFKHINDTYGHDAGDAVLVQAAAWLQHVRESDLVSRLGGDEFAVLLAGAQDQSAVEGICQRIVESFAATPDLNGKTLQSSPSIGVALFPADGEARMCSTSAPISRCTKPSIAVEILGVGTIQGERSDRASQVGPSIDSGARFPATNPCLPAAARRRLP